MAIQKGVYKQRVLEGPGKPHAKIKRGKLIKAAPPKYYLLISETGTNYRAKANCKGKLGRRESMTTAKATTGCTFNFKTPYFLETMATATMTPEVPPESTWWLSRGE